MLNSWYRRARSVWQPAWRRGGIVLAYHRVATRSRDPHQLAVSPANFTAHLDLLRRDATLMPLDEMIARARRRALPERAVAITFDDGYADTLHVAAPLLSARGVPASVFITTSAIETTGEFWWDAVERLVHHPGSAPRRVRITLNGVTESHDTGERLVRALCAHARTLTPEHRGQLLDELERQSVAPAFQPSDRALTADEVGMLARVDGITLGSHTRSHTSLAHLDRARQQAEIADARRSLESWANRPVTTFAYPFGDADTVSLQAATAVVSAGVTMACTTQPGRANRWTDPMHVPRTVVRDWSGAEFRRRWESWVQ